MLIAFYDAQWGGWLDWAIARKTRRPGVASLFSHVEIVLQQHPKSSLAICASSSPRDGGVRIKIIDVNEHFFTIDWPGADANDSRSQLFLSTTLGKKYDYLGVLGFEFHRLWWADDHHRYFCSEWCTAFLQRQGLLSTLKPLCTSPQGFFWHLLSKPDTVCRAPGGGIVTMDWFRRAAQSGGGN